MEIGSAIQPKSDIEELDTAETAAQLGLSQSIVRVRLHRARQALRTLIQRTADNNLTVVQPASQTGTSVGSAA
jgi:hypothetical protein